MKTGRRIFYGNAIQIKLPNNVSWPLEEVLASLGARAKCINLTKTATFVTPDSTSVVCCIGWIPSNKNRWVWRVFQKDAQALKIQENMLSPPRPEPLGRVPHRFNSPHLKDPEGTFSWQKKTQLYSYIQSLRKYRYWLPGCWRPRQTLISRPFLDKDSIWHLFRDRVDLQNDVVGVS